MNLYRLARTANSIQTLASGDPRRIARRGKNLLLGRLLARAGVWQRLWR